MATAFAHGFVLAFALILPFGPQNTFVLTQGATLPRWRSVLAIVLTAALADTVLIVAAIGGVSLIVLAIPALRAILSMAGILFLVYMGYQAWTAPVSGAAEGAGRDWTLGRRVRHSLSVSWLNPHAIMDTLVVIGGGAAVYATTPDRWSYALGATLVSWVWFFGLALAGRLLQKVAGGPALQRWFNRGSAVLLWGVAARFALQIGRSILSQSA